ncbi:hypothetical protein I4F81_001070 [Pyropia yezoensis]|uniref:Uncharacterized protein n=1 Tax=Pyropia yezoensis TaxID=2788 RepID=A0ACC3BKJ7_PYRYE|nr:hypothetical protein I4F81_001070 [Neopyropia yezoensis]
MRPQELTTRSIDTAGLIPLFDASRCVALQVEQNVSDLFSALAAYAADADATTTSLTLPARLWRESERMDEDEQGAAGADMFTVRTHAGVGAHAVPWRGRTVWVVMAVSRTPSMRGDFPRSLFLYSELEGAPLQPLERGGGDAAAGDGPSPDAAATVAGITDNVASLDVASLEATPHAVAREHLTSFVKHVLAWERTRCESRLPTHFELFRWKVEDPTRGRWQAQGVHLSRSVDSVILDSRLRDDLLADARAFGDPAARSWYAAHGVPYRRAYLFYGPPGTGKSSFVRVLAGCLQRSVSFLQCSHKMSDALLADAFRDAPRNTLMVVEDIDTLFAASVGGEAGQREARAGVGITLSGLLNALDGLISGTGGRITILSSNHPGLLDAALVRPGRVDKALRFARPGRDALAALFASFYPGPDAAAVAAAAAFADAVEGGGHSEASRSIASLQQLFIKHRNEPDPAVVVADVIPFLDAVEESRGEMEEGKRRDGASLYV